MSPISRTPAPQPWWIPWLLPLLAASCAYGQLESGFRQPPDSARPQTYWFWMNGHVTRDGITRDLEAMKRVGLGGAFIFDGGTYLPKGPVDYLSPAWRDLMGHAVREGNRLGLEIGMHNGPGWSSSGGPWITPERSMQQLVWTETTVSGPKRIDIALPQPSANEGYYRDAFVLAFPTPAGEDAPYPHGQPVHVDPQNPLVLKFAEPFEARAITVFPGHAGRLPNLTLEASDDGVTYRRIGSVNNPGRHGIQPPAILSFPAVHARYFRLVPAGAGDLADVALHHGERIEDWTFKSNLAYRAGREMQPPAASGREFAIDPAQVRDVTAQVDSEGHLTWDAPAGAWTILRIGQTATGQKNISASQSGQGLECDKMSRQATEFHFTHVVDQVIAAAGPAAAKSFGAIEIDSYEAGMQNWTAQFPEEFRQRNGYDIRAYLPAMTGRIVGDRAISERFLFDVRRTQADLMAEYYYGWMGELCRRRGLKFYIEGYGPGTFDELQVGGVPDVPMTEFWERTPWTPNRVVKMVSSAAHIYGKPVVAAESFTGEETTARWQEYPYSLKILGDYMFSLGLNQMVFHRYAHQPHPDAAPGMAMGPWGFFFDRNNTWFEQSKPWVEYLTRSQYLLRQGNYVADVLYFVGEQSPNIAEFEIPAMPAGYTYDLVNADVLLHRATVRDGRIELAGSGSYRVLVLPGDLKGMTPELARKLRDLVDAGAKVAGPVPEFSPTLRGYPAADAEVRQIGERLRGRVLSGSLTEVLHQIGVRPDFEYSSRNPDGALSWLHRKLADGDLYFVANRQRRSEDVVCTFRVAGRQPELWNAETGEIARPAIYSTDDGRVSVPMHVGPAESVFVVFRGAARQHLTTILPYRVALPAEAKMVNNFTIAVWVKPDIDLRLMPHESATGRIDETGKNYVVPAPEGDTLYGEGHAAAGIAVGRNGAYVVERSSTSAPAVLVWNGPVSGWTHLAVVYRGGRPSLFLNGKLVREGVASGKLVHPGTGAPPPAPETVFHFDQLDALLRTSGHPSPPSQGFVYYFEGNMTKPEVFNQALTDQRILELASAKMPAPEAPPDIQWSLRPDGTVEGLVWRTGRYALQNGAAVQAQVADPVELAGPWHVAFPAGPAITLPELISLHKHPDPAVKYFSGTATYAHDLNISGDALGGGKRVVLDLGRVEVIAEVRINGKDLGILWKEPYRIDVTDAVHAGANALEIRVTNLWPNRLIGDERLPPENQFGSGAEHGILRVPDWYLNGEPKPAGGRTTFVTWQFYKKDDPLLESGLLGPVRILYPVRAVAGK